MHKKLIGLVCLTVYCLSSSNIYAEKKAGIFSGGKVSSGGQVKSIGIGLPVLTRRKTIYSGKSSMTIHQSAPAVVRIQSSEISPEFMLGDVYVYPNPAKGVQIPTFHIESGIADSVKITIYNVAGEIAHNYVITGAPFAINDGNGLSYAYEYAWRGHIPSGMYYFAVESRKAGKILRRTGKLAIVR